MLAWYRWDGDDLILNVHLQPKSSRDEICGTHGDALKIKITAPPIDGKANAHLIKFLAKQFGVAKSKIELISGETSREKRLRVHQPKKLLADMRTRD